MIPEDGDRRTSSDWHLDKTIPITHIGATVTMLLAGVWYLAGQDQRITVNELNIEHVSKTSLDRDLSIENTAREEALRTNRTIDRIDAKLDKIFEYVRQNN